MNSRRIESFLGPTKASIGMYKQAYDKGAQPLAAGSSFTVPLMTTRKGEALAPQRRHRSNVQNSTRCL